MTRPPVLILANHIDGLGGVERVAHGLAAGLSGRGYDVALRGIRPTSGPSAQMTMTGYTTGFMSDRTERPEGERPHPAVVRRAMRREALDNLRTTLADYRDGVVICMQVYSMEHLVELGLDDLLDSGTRIIGQYHWSYQGARSNTDFDRLSRTYRRIDKFLLLTQADADNFTRHNFNNAGAMPNPLWLKAQAAEDIPRSKRLVALSRYDAVKQLDHALRAWARVAPDFPDWSFELYGDGPMRAELAALIDDLGISDSARLMGPTNDVEGVLRSSRLSVLSSQFEGLPMVLAESLACGVPAVAYDCAPGVSEIITDGVDGFVVPQNHIPGLASALRTLMADEELTARMGAAGHVSARRYDREHVMDRWEDLIARVQR
ncbi:glycosyltransferase [Knoellia koreensis]|uniref:Glycosyltransferase n=1 Tax=Knoellia koreensis TaxID=2730921 RepID=A0A849H9H8_9MICO|nr:glycosyltransferase [Knoellia sp. DB2414S]NNM46396.1 glycosyltransferase [Knoellia sp. DB2414S]